MHTHAVCTPVLVCMQVHVCSGHVDFLEDIYYSHNILFYFEGFILKAILYRIYFAGCI